MVELVIYMGIYEADYLSEDSFRVASEASEDSPLSLLGILDRFRELDVAPSFARFVFGVPIYVHNPY